MGLKVLARELVGGAGDDVFENGRGLTEKLSGTRLGVAEDGEDGGGCSLTKAVDPRRGSRGDVAGLGLVVDDNLGVVDIVPR